MDLLCKIKIAYFLDIPQGLGGAGNTLLEQAKMMKQLHNVIVVIPCSENGEINKEYEHRCQEAGLVYRGMFFDTTNTIQKIDLLTVENTWEEIYHFIQKEQIELVHSVQLNIAVEMAARKAEIPHLMNIYQLREEEFNIQYGDIFPKYHSCDSVLYSNQWKEKMGIVSECIRVAAPLETIKKKQAYEISKLKILMLGDVCERKNQLQAIMAIHECKRRGISVILTIAGRDNTHYAQKCREYIETNHLQENVKMLGFLSDVKEVLLQNDCYLCASKDESFPSSLVESLTYDLTILSTPVAGVPELMKDRENAFLSQGYEAEDFVGLITECLASYQEGTIAEIHQKAWETWNDNFARAVVCEKLNEYYKKIVLLEKNEIKRKGDYEIFFEKANSLNRLLIDQGVTQSIISKRLYYYLFLRSKLKSKDVFIWGAGQWGKIANELIERLFTDVKVKGFIDICKKGTYCGKKIYFPDEITFENNIYVFLAFYGEYSSVIQYLEKRNLVYNQDIWTLP